MISATTTTVFPITTQGDDDCKTWSFDDGNGNISSINQSFLVDDITPPSTPVLSTVMSDCLVPVSLYLHLRQQTIVLVPLRAQQLTLFTMTLLEIIQLTGHLLMVMAIPLLYQKRNIQCWCACCFKRHMLPVHQCGYFGWCRFRRYHPCLR